MKSYGAIVEGLADSALLDAFGAEWEALDAHSARLVRQDFMEASDEDGTGPKEYARRIGKGNLRSYANVMITRERLGWNK